MYTLVFCFLERSAKCLFPCFSWKSRWPRQHSGRGPNVDEKSDLGTSLYHRLFIKKPKCWLTFLLFGNVKFEHFHLRCPVGATFPSPPPRVNTFPSPLQGELATSSSTLTGMHFPQRSMSNSCPSVPERTLWHREQTVEQLSTALHSDFHYGCSPL